MGWKLKITDPQDEIWDHEIDLIVRELPPAWRKFIPEGESMKQVYGYPAYGTISIPVKNEITITGSYITTTPDEVTAFLSYLVNELKSYGHKELRFENCSEMDMFHLTEVIPKLEALMKKEDNDGGTEEIQDY